MIHNYGQRAPPPPPPKKPSSQPSISAPTSYRPAPTPPSAATPALDRSTSQRTPVKPAKTTEIGRSNTTKDRRPPAAPQQGTTANSNGLAAGSKPKPSPGSSQTDLPLKQQQQPHQQHQQTAPASRAVDPRAQAQNHPPSPAASNLAKVAGVATPRRREKKVDKAKDEDIIKRLQQICTDADPTKLYRNLVKIGQG